MNIPIEILEAHILFYSEGQPPAARYVMGAGGAGWGMLSFKVVTPSPTHSQCVGCHYHHGMDRINCAVHPCGHPDSSADCPDWRRTTES